MAYIEYRCMNKFEVIFVFWYCLITMTRETFTFQSIYICSDQQVFVNVYREFPKPPHRRRRLIRDLICIIQRPSVVVSINLIQNPYSTHPTEHIIPRVVLFLFSAHNPILKKKPVLTDFIIY